MSKHISFSQVKHIAKLATLPISDEKAKSIEGAFEETLAVIENLQQLSVNTLEPTHQVTGLENVMRDDVVDTNRMFNQEDALKNAKKSSDGFFVVERILDND